MPEIDAGNAHLMTRNELAEFIDWWINLGSDENANAVIYDEMNNGNADVARHQKIAKDFFVHKGYEGDSAIETNPDDLHCDYCSVVENAGDLTHDWNGETGNHLSCEANQPVYSRNDLVRFFNYLTANTDTFDKVMVQIERELGDDHVLPADLVDGIVEDFLKESN